MLLFKIQHIDQTIHCTISLYMTYESHCICPKFKCRDREKEESIAKDQTGNSKEELVEI